MPADELIDWRNMKMMMCWCSFAAAMMLALIPALVRGDDHIVGGNHGWQVPADAGVGLNYSQWAAQETFYLGDFISFHYQEGLHTVFEVNKTVYESCHFGATNIINGSAELAGLDENSTTAGKLDPGTHTMVSVVHNWSTKGGRSIIPLNESRVYYFACGVGQHCLQGMKVGVSVLPMPRSSSFSSSSSSSLTSSNQTSYPSSASASACPSLLHLSPFAHLSLLASLCMYHF
ncbi:hypothetical protein L7F22_055077 [Adiantum nelumboides]|nr:hypothetical protein [Adiantum nelumboides]